MNDDTSFETHRQQETRDFILQLRRLIAEKDAEIERLKETTTHLQRECAKRGQRVADLERLIIRAADALEFWIKDLASTEQHYEDAAVRDERLLSELRKATQ